MQDVIDITYLNLPTFYYVRLGALLEFFEEKLMYYATTPNNTSPLLNFDFEVETNLMYINELQVSLDPNICIVNRTLNIDGNVYTFTPKSAELFESPELGSSYGQIMNIYVNMKWVLLKLEELKDPNNNKTVLIDFLNNILSSINGALGGTTSLETTLDDSTNTIIIRDKNPLPNLDNVISVLNRVYDKNISDKYTHFDLYGYSTNDNTNNKSYGGNGHASFIKSFNFTTEITKDLSTMLTVGATANSTVVGEDSTAFSKFNAGLTDRFKETVIESPNLPPTTIDPGETEEQILIKKYRITYQAYYEYLKKLGGNPPQYNGDAENYKDAITNYTTYRNQIQKLLYDKKIKELQAAGKPVLKPYNFTPNTGFIPFNLSLTMDGLSGMKIYSKFFIDTAFLPANYPDNADFIIKNIEHKIENNKWFTTIESIVISKGEADPALLKKKTNTTITTTNTSTAPKTQPVYNPSTSLTNASETELYYETILTKLGAPKTTGNILFLKAWRQAEGGKATWNGFNTTLKKSGSTPYNSVGVQNYTSLDQGAQAIVDTLLKSNNGLYYKNIVAGLKKGLNTQPEALFLAAQLQQNNQDLFIWVRGPRGTSPLVGYVYSILKYKVGSGQLYKV